MKKYTINGIATTKSNFNKELQRCFTKGESMAAGATNGIIDSARLAEVTKRLNQGWTFHCIYAPAGINAIFKITEAKK